MLSDFQYTTYSPVFGIVTETVGASSVYEFASFLDDEILDDDTRLLLVATRVDGDEDYSIMPDDVFLALVESREGNWVSVHQNDGQVYFDNEDAGALMTADEYLNTFTEDVKFNLVLVRWEGTDAWVPYEFADNMVEAA